MTEPAALQKLVTWLSPAFPVGAFAWSAGLETAIADRRVTDSERLQNWIDGALAHGGIRTDAILLAHAHRAFADQAGLQELADLSLAIVAINGWNRLAIGFRAEPGSYQPAKPEGAKKSGAH